MDSAKESVAPTNTELSVRGVKEPGRGAGVQPRAISEAIRGGESKFTRLFDWQACVKDHPYLTLGLAVGAGMMLVGLLKPRPAPKKQLVKILSNNMAGASRRIERRVESLAEQPARVGTSIKAAAAT